jgi:hypothetical protein
MQRCATDIMEWCPTLAIRDIEIQTFQIQECPVALRIIFAQAMQDSPTMLILISQVADSMYYPIDQFGTWTIISINRVDPLNLMFGQHVVHRSMQ